MTRFVPRFFEADFTDGKPILSAEGRAAIEAEIKRGVDAASGSKGASGAASAAPTPTRAAA